MPMPLRSRVTSTSAQRHGDLLLKSVAARFPTGALFSSSQRLLHRDDQLGASISKAIGLQTGQPNPRPEDGIAVGHLFEVFSPVVEDSRPQVIGAVREERR